EWFRPAESLTPLVINENRTARDDRLPESEPAANLRQTILLEADVDHPASEQHRFGLDPHRGNVAFTDHRVGRHCRSIRWLFGLDVEAREHVGLEHAARIANLGPDHDTARGQVRSRADRVDARLGDSVWSSGDLGLDLLPDADQCDLL